MNEAIIKTEKNIISSIESTRKKREFAMQIKTKNYFTNSQE